MIGQQAHYPFGEDWYASSSITKFKFTSYERDAESGNDYAVLRTSVNRLGRFSSPDPFAGSLADPQSLNRYAYTRNDDPGNLVDPLGLSPYFLSASEGGSDAFLGLLLGGGDVTRWGFYVGIFCSPVILLDPWNEGINSFAGWDCGPTQGRRSRGPAFDLAKKLAENEKCLHFLVKTVLAAAANVKGAALTDAEKDFYSGRVSAIPDKLETAPLVEKLLENPTTTNGYNTLARAELKTGSIILYKNFYNLTFLNQSAQTLVHEGTHLVTGFSDQNLAQGATNKKYEPNQGPEASVDFHNKLKENCN